MSEDTLLRAAGRAVGYILAVAFVAGALIVAIGALRLLGQVVLG